MLYRKLAHPSPGLHTFYPRLAIVLYSWFLINFKFNINRKDRQSRATWSWERISADMVSFNRGLYWHPYIHNTHALLSLIKATFNAPTPMLPSNHKFGTATQSTQLTTASILASRLGISWIDIYLCIGPIYPLLSSDHLHSLPTFHFLFLERGMAAYFCASILEICPSKHHHYAVLRLQLVAQFQPILVWKNSEINIHTMKGPITILSAIAKYSRTISILADFT